MCCFNACIHSINDQIRATTISTTLNTYFFVVTTFKIFSFSCLKIHNTLLFAIVTLLCISSCLTVNVPIDQPLPVLPNDNPYLLYAPQPLVITIPLSANMKSTFKDSTYE